MAFVAPEATPFVRALLAERDRRNGQFAQARHVNPDLDAGAFAAFLRDAVAPVVNAVAAVAPGREADVTETLYALALELVGRGLLGAPGCDPTLTGAWRDVLVAAAGNLASQPLRLTTALSNALLNIVCTPGARPAAWAGQLATVAPACPDLPTLLAAGVVLAWQAGMAHYRTAALAACRTLLPAVATQALGLPPTTEASLERVLTRLEGDPWLHPQAALAAPIAHPLRLTHRLGGFRGFGGIFLAPPTVAFVGQFIVSDPDRSWTLYADRFGATFHPTSPVVTSAPTPGRFRLAVGGRINADGQEWTFPELLTVTSWATDDVTVAATTALSHDVLLFARAAVGEAV